MCHVAYNFKGLGESCWALLQDKDTKILIKLNSDFVSSVGWTVIAILALKLMCFTIVYLPTPIFCLAVLG